MALIEIGSAAALQELIASHPSGICVTFSAHWCGPCKASHGQLQQLAAQNAEQRQWKMGIVYESDLGQDIHTVYRVRAFPTYIVFCQGQEQGRVEGVNLPAVQQLMEQYMKKDSNWSATPGATLGGGTDVTALTPEQARLQRLAKLGGGGTAATTTTEGDAATTTEPETNTAAATSTNTTAEPMDTEENAAAASTSMDYSTDSKEDETVTMEDPAAKLDPEALKLLTESMGFSLLRAQKGLLNGPGGTIDGAVEWLTDHQDDADIDDPIPAVKAQSYKCNDCGKILSNMANLELHANKTGHADFEESTERVVPLTADEKAAKIAEIKELLKAKRAEREEAEKVDETDREKQRRFMGKEMAKTREQLEQEQRKREAMLRKKEKEDFKRERARLRAELARDKAERQAHQGKLASKLGVEGYHPDAVQYDVPVDGTEPHSQSQEQEQQYHKKPKTVVNVQKIDDYIHKVSQYRAGGDGGKCLKVLKTYVSNVMDHPDEAKYRTINMENKAFKAKVKPFIGAKQLLMAVGFHPPEQLGTGTLVMDDTPDYQLLNDTKAKLEAAMIAFG